MARILNLIYDRERGTLLDSFERLRPVTIGEVLSPIRFGDLFVTNLYLGTIQHDRGLPYFRTESITGTDPSLYVYNPEADLTGSYIKFTYGGSSTDDLDFEQATMESIERELNQLSTIQSDGGVRVHGTKTAMSIVFGDKGAASSTISVDIDSPFDFVVDVTDAVTGSASAREVQAVSILRQLMSYQVTADSALGSSAPTITRTEVVTGDATTREVVEWSISPEPQGGTWILNDGSTDTTAIQHNATAEQLEDAVNAVLGASTVSVDKVGRARWRMYYSTVGARTPMTSDNSALDPRLGMTWQWALGYAAGIPNMGGDRFKILEAVLEFNDSTVSGTPADDKQVLAQGPVQVGNRYHSQTPDA